MSEGLKPLYDEDGKVNDPRVAEVMAETEDKMRKYRDQGATENTQALIDVMTDGLGKSERYDLMLEDTAETIRKALSPSEMELIIKIVSGNDDASMERLVRKIAQK